MEFKNINENTKSVSNFNEDFKEYLGIIKYGISSLEDSIERYGNLVYDVDGDDRSDIFDNIEFLGVLLIKYNACGYTFKRKIFQELSNVRDKLSLLYHKTNHHFFLIASGKMQLLVSFVLENCE